MLESSCFLLESCSVWKAKLFFCRLNYWKLNLKSETFIRSIELSKICSRKRKLFVEKMAQNESSSRFSSKKLRNSSKNRAEKNSNLKKNLKKNSNFPIDKKIFQMKKESEAPPNKKQSDFPPGWEMNEIFNWIFNFFSGIFYVFNGPNVFLSNFYWPSNFFIRFAFSTYLWSPLPLWNLSWPYPTPTPNQPLFHSPPPEHFFLSYFFTLKTNEEGTNGWGGKSRSADFSHANQIA